MGLAVCTKVKRMAAGNPVKRVLGLLRKMEEKVTEEGKKEKELFDKFMCYCETHQKELADSIEKDQRNLPVVSSSIKEAVALKSSIDADLQHAKKDREAAKAAVAEGKALREKESAAFQQLKSKNEATIAALVKAIEALRRGVAKSDFLQTSAGATVQQVILAQDLNPGDRDVVSAFLSEDESYGDGTEESDTKEVIGILSQIKENMEKDEGQSQAEEAKAAQEFEVMARAKELQIRSLSHMIEIKTTRSGEVAVDIVEKKGVIDDTKTQLDKNEAMLKQMQGECEKKKHQQEQVSASRTQELIAIKDTMKILNDDDAREVLKKETSGGSSFLQLQVSSDDMRKEALTLLKAAKHQRDTSSGPGKDARLDLLCLALRSKKANFDKVITLVNNMIGLLAKEQAADDTTKERCQKETRKTSAEAKVIQRDLSDIDKAMEEGKDKMVSLKEQVAVVAQGITELDQMVQEAGAQRKLEHKEFSESRASNSAATHLLKKAKQRLLTFYNQRLAQATALEQTRAKDETDVEAAADRVDESGSQEPEKYSKKEEEAGGVVEMVNLIIADLAKEMQVLELNEKDSQADYETSMQEAVDKRTVDARTITQMEGRRAEIEGKLHKWAHTFMSSKKELAETNNYLMDLHQECDWLLANYDARKKARANEKDSLSRAKAILSGADYS